MEGIFSLFISSTYIYFACLSVCLSARLLFLRNFKNVLNNIWKSANFFVTVLYCTKRMLTIRSKNWESVPLKIKILYITHSHTKWLYKNIMKMCLYPNILVLSYKFDLFLINWGAVGGFTKICSLDYKRNFSIYPSSWLIIFYLYIYICRMILIHW